MKKGLDCILSKDIDNTMYSYLMCLNFDLRKEMLRSNTGMAFQRWQSVKVGMST